MGDSYQPKKNNMPKIAQVVVADENNGIGRNNQLLCHLPADLKHFKALTVGHPVIMGRKTYDSMGKPLINRRNIVVSRQSIELPGCEIAHSIDEAIALCHLNEKVSIIGGATIYKQSLDLTDIIYLTRIHHSFEADTFFPKIDNEQWTELASEQHDADEKNPYPYTFITLIRKSG